MQLNRYSLTIQMSPTIPMTLFSVSPSGATPSIPSKNMLPKILLLPLIAVLLCVHAHATERDIFYPSTTPDGQVLQIRALIVSPNPSLQHLSSDRYPVILFNHGGISGLNENAKRRCRELSAQGYLVFATSFRGEDQSGGNIEVALGEVDDVLAGLSWLDQRAQTEHADMQRVALLGFSHGALVSLQAAKRSHRFKALVFSYGVSDVYRWVQYLRDSKQLGTDRLTTMLYGTGPQSRPKEYAARFGLANLDRLDPALEVFIVQGKLDVIVPPQQAEALARALNAHRIQTSTRYFEHATHGFLIRREALIGVEKRESDQAWREIYAFLARVLA
jgi:dipeptidyl aminopeptidase/acylaminoacyl peptidase